MPDISRFDLHDAFFSGLWGKPMRVLARFKDYAYVTPLDDEFYEPKRIGQGYELLPDTPEQTEAREMLMRLMTQRMAFPTRDIVGMTETEQMAQRLLGEYAGAETPEARTASMEALRKIISEPQDITQLPEYRGILEGVEGETADLVNQTLRRLQLQGMGTSRPQSTAVGKELAYGRERAIAGLAPIAASERSRRMDAMDLLEKIIGAEDARKMNQFGAVQMFGALPRQIEQQEKDTEFQRLMQELYAPYESQVPLIDRIMNEVRYMYDPGMLVQSQHQTAGDVSNALSAWFGKGSTAAQQNPPQQEQKQPVSKYDSGGGGYDQKSGYSEPYPNYNAGTGGGGYYYGGGQSGGGYRGGYGGSYKENWGGAN